MQSEDDINILQDTHQALLFGSPVHGIPGSLLRYPLRQTLLYSQMCNQQSSANCTTYHNHVNDNGLNAALEEYVRVTLQAIHSSRAIINLEGGLNSSKFDFVQTMERTYVREALSEASSLYISEQEDGVDVFMTNRLYTTLAFIGILAMMQLFMYRPLLNFMLEDIMRTRSLVLILPPKVQLPHETYMCCCWKTSLTPSLCDCLGNRAESKSARLYHEKLHKRLAQCIRSSTLHKYTNTQIHYAH